MKYFCVLIALFCATVKVDCIMWNLEPNTQKCLKEELQKNVLVTGEFDVSEAPGQKVDYIVRSNILIMGDEMLSVAFLGS